MKYLIFFASALCFLLSIESMWIFYIIAKGSFWVHIEQPVHFFVKLLICFLMSCFFMFMAYFLFKKVKGSVYYTK
ncbi:hypothetical protein B2E75_11720 [Salmonella enterica]|nr:hypothetical protein [Salmonella enterica]EBJ0943946.1 hypothetical protein [Salmonella enterica]EBK3082351.1 hypothetical protein [Salmonella enterica]EBN0690435.1 hypothetical protein [Salmonella enterica]EDO5947455.1 hypothetical protein [Salmonella enterica]